MTYETEKSTELKRNLILNKANIKINVHDCVSGIMFLHDIS